MFFAVWKHAPIKTTLLRELEELCDVTYREFEDPEELRSDLQHFFLRIAKGMASRPPHLGPIAQQAAGHAEHSDIPV
jgi:carbamoyl-phosphate synthase large subunit